MSAKQRFFYGWAIVAIGLLVYSLAYGFRYSFAVMFTSIADRLQASRSATAGILSLHLLVYGAMAPIAGTLIDRLGARRTMGVGLVIFAAGIAAAGLSNHLWQYYLSFGLVMGVGLSLSSAVPFVRLISQWFVSRRGLALSLMMSGSGFAHLLYPSIAFLIEQVGLLYAFLAEAAVVIMVILPVILLFVRDAPKSNSQPTPVAAPAMTSPIEADWTLARALRSSRFWWLCLTSFTVWGITEHTMVTHHVAAAEDAGFSKIYASSILAVFGLTTALGTFSGLVSDRIGREVTFTIGTVLGVFGLVIMMLITDASRPWLLYLYAIFFGFGIGLTIPTLSASAVDLFPGRRAGVIIGFVWLIYAIGGAIGPWLGGVIFETAGRYLPAFILAAAAFIISCASLWLAAPRRQRLVSKR